MSRTDHGMCIDVVRGGEQDAESRGRVGAKHGLSSSYMTITRSHGLGQSAKRGGNLLNLSAPRSSRTSFSSTTSSPRQGASHFARRSLPPRVAAPALACCVALQDQSASTLRPRPAYTSKVGRRFAKFLCKHADTARLSKYCSEAQTR